MAQVGATTVLVGNDQRLHGPHISKVYAARFTLESQLFYAVCAPGGEAFAVRATRSFAIA
jgi:hypothetical protein